MFSSNSLFGLILSLLESLIKFLSLIPNAKSVSKISCSIISDIVSEKDSMLFSNSSVTILDCLFSNEFASLVDIGITASVDLIPLLETDSASGSSTSP